MKSSGFFMCLCVVAMGWGYGDAAVSHPPQFTIVVLDLGNRGVVNDVNDRGDFIGENVTPSDRFQAVLLKAKGQLEVLGYGTGEAISDTGYVSLTTLDTLGTQRCARWTERSGIVDLTPLSNGPISELNCLPLRINNHGEMVGMFTSSEFPNGEAFRWTKDGQAIDMGTFNGDRIGVVDINDRGEIAGSVFRTTANGGSRAIRWSARDGFVELPCPQGNSPDCNALGMNNRGDVVGLMANNAVVWTSDQILAINPPPGYYEPRPEEINDHGWVVGHIYAPSGSRAFLWTEATGMIDLGTLKPGDDAGAYNLNNDGVIVGYNRSRTSGQDPVAWIPKKK